jgi:hypothetical protein
MRRQCPALAAWRDELRRGVRTIHDRDALAKAASWEAAAIEAERDGCPNTAIRCRQRVVDILDAAIAAEVA